MPCIGMHSLCILSSSSSSSYSFLSIFVFISLHLTLSLTKHSTSFAFFIETRNEYALSMYLCLYTLSWILKKKHCRSNMNKKEKKKRSLTVGCQHIEDSQTFSYTHCSVGMILLLHQHTINSLVDFCCYFGYCYKKNCVFRILSGFCIGIINLRYEATQE